MKIKGKYLFKPEVDKLLHFDQILPVYANKILPEHSHTINPSLKKKKKNTLSTAIFFPIIAELSSCDKKCIVCKA